MSIDMAQFHQVFFEDSLEGLAVMETGLMELEPGNADAQTINSIFRAAHSIKGGSGTFGFRVIADFTHVMETLLDQIRDLKREVTRDNTDLLLLAVDCLREMLEAAQAGDEANAERIAQHQREMEQELGNSVSQSDNAQLLQPPAISLSIRDHIDSWLAHQFSSGTADSANRQRAAGDIPRAVRTGRGRVKNLQPQRVKGTAGCDQVPLQHARGAQMFDSAMKGGDVREAVRSYYEAHNNQLDDDIEFF